MKVDLSKIKRLLLSGPAQFTSGFLVGAGILYWNYNRGLQLALTDDDIRELKVNPGCAVYATEHGAIYVGMNDFSEGE